MVSFTAILWKLSGPLTIFGITIPRALFWIVVVYVLVRDVGVLDRPSVHPAELPQREDQRRVPLRAGAPA